MSMTFFFVLGDKKMFDVRRGPTRESKNVTNESDRTGYSYHLEHTALTYSSMMRKETEEE